MKLANYAYGEILKATLNRSLYHSLTNYALVYNKHSVHPLLLCSPLVSKLEPSKEAQKEAIK
ncbi:hypothetical protein KIN20_026424 [Parelaphostrongylus tenuis]|uniref:Uncharacterized protein n=1 Tax=Parelaphostrongylus tenuis TaxID=148309 RepID=A0AAD5QY20_PARTN|nr:hypothetical protein KIN20_026424 [Parelaphostrongylus tenuis]